MWGKPPPLSQLQRVVEDPSNAIGMRMRAAYFLKQAYTNSSSSSNNECLVEGDDGVDDNGSDEKINNSFDEEQSSRQRQDRIIQTLASGLQDERHGSLMRHEYAYVMGQLKDERCCEPLEAALGKEGDCVMVRHEAAEALGAIGAERSRSVLEDTILKNPDCPELSDTCRLALNVMDWRIRGDPEEPAPAACACMLNPYSSVDPAPPHPSHADKADSELGEILRDSTLSIFDRYRAMFSLRNRGGSDAVKELGRALVEDASSALLRHEVAYVLGQMQHPDSVAALTESLSRRYEHMMVRHESAEALGAIDGGDWTKIESTLEHYAKDACLPVAESCVVALDAADYWGHHGGNVGADGIDIGDADVDDAGDLEGAAAAKPKGDGVDVLSFRQQKNLLDGKSMATTMAMDAPIIRQNGGGSRNPQVLAGHFNVAVGSQ
eukprot:CAMPEP_0119554174 /NCGR_PEP_ID=MMETSP1352-20130426/6731_1 /TAXON_ID=265584 /ORGANISM="Stauroneis constricta, Strain CCMP1120" /LENGTH=435 /DNA_ID=CAMNT_0007600717 /DNA_START=176 /DNA_END=1483 /DNA_ORIENTATION=+